MAVTPLSDGGYVETTAIGEHLHVQKYTASGTPAGAEHIYFRPLGPVITPLPNGGYVFHYEPYRMGGHGPNSTVLDVYDTASTLTGGGFFPQQLGPVLTTSPDGFAVAINIPDYFGPEQDAAFYIYNLSGSFITGFRIDNAATITALSSGDFKVSWIDDGGGAHTLVIDPHNPPSLSPPETPIVTSLDNVGPVKGLISTVTDDTTPTLRIAVKEVGAIEIGMGTGVWYAITAADVSRGYKDIELSLPAGLYTHTLAVRFQDADGLLSQWAHAGFTVDTVSPIFVGNDAPGQLLTGSTGNDIFYAGRNSVVMTGGNGADTYIFQQLPWNAGRITDFALGADRLNLSTLFAASGYSGFDPLADGYLRFQSDGQGGTRVYFDPDGPAPGNPWPFLMTTLEGVSPIGLTSSSLFYPSAVPSPTPQITLVANDTRDQILIGGAGGDYFYTGHNSVVMTGGGGPDTFVFQYVPWNNTGHITDFALSGDKLDFSSLFAVSGYHGSDPVADGYIRFQSDGAGGTRVLFDADGPGGNALAFLITTLDHVSPNGLTASQLFGGIALPPPPPPPPSGQTLTGNDTRGQVLTGGSGDDIFYAGHNSAVMSGDGGADRYVFQYLPWNGARITDFASGIDVLDLRVLFDASNYAGQKPIADGYLRFEANGSGGTKVLFDPDGPASGNPWAFLIVTLDGVQPSGIHSGDWVF